MRVSTDTNVLISAFLTRGLCADVVRVTLKQHELVIVNPVLDELLRVLESKFEADLARLDQVRAFLSQYLVSEVTEVLPSVALRDISDEQILAAAIAADADLLITGDKDLLVVASEIHEIRIVSPREFWMTFRDVP